MTLKTLGMGIAKVVTKSIKKGAGSVKQGFLAPKGNKPLAAMTGVFEVGRHGYNKLTGKKDIHEGTITGIVKEVTKGIKKVIKKKKDKK